LVIAEKIIIEGNEVYLQELRGDGEVCTTLRTPVSSLLRYLAWAMPSPLPLFPTGVRWLCQQKELLFLVVEHPPQCRTLLISEEKVGGQDYKTYRLAFPYIIYLLTFYRGSFEEMKMFYRLGPLSTPHDPLFYTNLPNVRGEPGHYGTQRVCLRYRPEMLENKPLAETVPALIDFFWSTGFNKDIASSSFERARRRDSRLAGFDAWEEATRANPLFMLEIDWEPTEKSIPALWLECLKLHGETGQPVSTAEELADILYRLPVGY